MILAFISSLEEIYIIENCLGFLNFTSGTLGPMTVFHPNHATPCTKSAAEELVVLLEDKDNKIVTLEYAKTLYSDFAANVDDKSTL